MKSPRHKKAGESDMSYIHFIIEEWRCLLSNDTDSHSTKK